MQKYINNRTVQDELGKWLGGHDWTFWATPTTGYTMTLNSARRAMHRLHDILDRRSPTTMFWAAERFDCKEGYHTHTLIKTNDDFNLIVQAWQKASGGIKEGSWQRIQLDHYDKQLGASHYLSKYVTKKITDYDLLSPGCSRGYMSYKRF